MEGFDIYKDITERTGGDIYIGVVGPVRTGKSTFIKGFMEQLVIPNINNDYDRERSQDELPQSGNGRSVMTTEPKFVPAEAVEVEVGGQINFRVRLVDCVGYAVEGAIGFETEKGARMVMTPWVAEPISFVEAAELGTQKVIRDHSTVGIVLTTDGSITDLPRKNYVKSEGRVIRELQEIGKPFAVILNSVHPDASETRELAQQLQEEYQAPVLPLNCLQLAPVHIERIMSDILEMFPLREIQVNYSAWVEELDSGHPLRQRIESAVWAVIPEISRVRHVEELAEKLRVLEGIEKAELTTADLGEGAVLVEVQVKRELFYETLEEFSGVAVRDDQQLLRVLQELSSAKKEYDKIADALAQVKATGYGIVQPSLSELTMAEPELIRQGNRFGLKLQATAPSIHLIRAEIMTEVTPIVGTEKQGEEFARQLTKEFEENPTKVWETDFFGRSMHDLVKEGIQSKLNGMPEDAQEKLQETLTKILNDGSGGLICIVL